MENTVRDRLRIKKHSGTAFRFCKLSELIRHGGRNPNAEPATNVLRCRSSFFLLLLVPLGTASPQKQVARKSTYAHIDQLIRSEFAKDNRGGLTVGIVEQGNLVCSRAYGFADEEAGQRATTRTIYPIASLTKMVTGIMLLQLAQNGKVHLADPFVRYVPEIKTIPNRFPWTPPITST